MTHRRLFHAATAALVTLVFSLLALVQFATAAPALRLTPTPSPSESAPFTSLDDAEAAWNALGVNEYWITISYGSAWDGMDLTLHVVGTNVLELRATCQPGPLSGDCRLYTIDPRDYTVPGLIAQTREMRARDDAEFTRITFDSQAPFITRISYDHPDIFDEQWFLWVRSFSSQNPTVSATATAIHHEMTATAQAMRSVTPSP